MLFRLKSRSSLRHTWTRLKTNADWLLVWRSAPNYLRRVMPVWTVSGISWSSRDQAGLTRLGLALLHQLFGVGNTKLVRPITAWGAESEAGLPWWQSCDGSVLEVNNGCCCWRTVVFPLGFGRDSSRLEVNIFFEKRTKNGTEIFPRK